MFMTGQVNRNREKLAEADLDDQDHQAIREFADHREFAEEVAASTLRTDICNLQAAAARAEQALVDFDSDKDAIRVLQINAAEFDVSEPSNDNYRKAIRVVF